MRPLAMLGAVVALVVAIFAVTWLSSHVPASNEAAKATPQAPSTLDAEAQAKAEAAVAKGEQVDTAAPAKPVVNWQEPHEQNPFEIEKEGPQPKALLVEQRYDFGEMLLGAEESHEFVIRNLGDAPLKLAKGTSTCKCTIPSIGENAVPPGGEVSVNLSWKPIQMDYSFAQQAFIWTNDPDQPKLTLVVEGKVVAEGFQIPEGSLPLGDIKQGETRTVVGHIFARQRKDLEIKSVETSNPALKVTFAPADETALTENGAASGFKFDITLEAAEQIGQVQETVNVHTNFEFEPVRVWQVFGNRPGPVKIVGTNWYAAKQLVLLKSFPAAEGSRQRMAVFLDKTETAGEVTDVKTKGPIKVRLERDDRLSAKNQLSDQYWMWVEFPAGGATGAYSVEAPLPVEIFTTHPTVRSMKFNVSYEAN
jgi:hypothetical protein